METKTFNRPCRPVLTQTENNTTLWIGHLQTDPNDHFAGQTFKCPDAGLLDNIQVYASSVHNPGQIELTLHEFDPATRNWGPAIGNSMLDVEKGNDSQWVRFRLDPVELSKDRTYGFRLQTKNALMGIGEAATGNKQPFTFGHEWNGDSKDLIGHFFSYFSLAFKVELAAC